MKLSEREVAEIEGLVYVLSRAPHDKKSQQLTEIIGRIKKMLQGFDKRRKQHLLPLKHALIVLLELLDHGTVVLMLASEEDRESFAWARAKLRYLLEHWEEI